MERSEWEWAGRLGKLGKLGRLGRLVGEEIVKLINKLFLEARKILRDSGK